MVSNDGRSSNTHVLACMRDEHRYAALVPSNAQHCPMQNTDSSKRYSCTLSTLPAVALDLLY